MRDMLGVALKCQGRSVNTRSLDELRAAGELIQKAKKNKNCLGFEGGVGGKNKVASNEACMAIVYNGDAIRAMTETQGVEYGVPKEGSIIWVDAMTVPAKAPNPEGAHRFIDFILDPKVGAQLSDFNRYASPNAGSLPLVKKEDRKNLGIYPSDETLKKLEYLEDVGKDTQLYDEVWTAVKAR